MGSDRSECRWRSWRISWFGHQSRFDLARLGCAIGHLPSSAISSPSGQLLRTSRSLERCLLPNPSYQVKLTNVIAAIRFTDGSSDPAAAPVFRRTGPAQPLWTCSGCLLHLTAGLVHADQGAGGGAGSHADRAR